MLKGKLNFGYCHSSKEEDFVRIEVIDQSSRVHFLEVRMTPEAAAAAFFGHRGETDCEFDIRRTDLIGKKHENKTVELPWTKAVNRDNVNKFKGGRDDEDVAPQIRKFLAKYEVDGWQGYVRDVFNFHNFTKDGVSVSFHRHV